MRIIFKSLGIVPLLALSFVLNAKVIASEANEAPAGAKPEINCQLPNTPQLPEGASANVGDMKAGQQAVKGYIEDSNAFLACLDETEVTAGESASEEFKVAILTAYNAAVQAQELLAGEFNDQIKAFYAAKK